jgi:acylphosphatase
MYPPVNTSADHPGHRSVDVLRATVIGRVQGVGFRLYVLNEARGLGLGGYVRNRPDGSVYVVAYGARPELERLLSALRRGPVGAWVERVETEWAQSAASEAPPGRFEVRH